MGQKQSEVPLTFAWLCNRVQNFAMATGRSLPTRLERWAFWGGVIAAGIGLLVGASWDHWLPSVRALQLLKFLFGIEMVGFLISACLMFRRALPQFIRSRQVHADEMDMEFAKWRELVDELRQFPQSQRAARLRFVQALRIGMDGRLGLVFGGTQRLGIFPLLIALYLQFRNWEWGDWAAAFDVNLVAALLIWALLLLFGAGWFLIGLRHRLDTYQNLLEESLAKEH